MDSRANSPFIIPITDRLRIIQVILNLRKLEPLENIERSPRHSPINEYPQLKQERYRHISIELISIPIGKGTHWVVCLHDLWLTFFDLLG
jgi:hypothetical protein